ncbi:MAG: MCP four helix bundle domain-containing protein [Bacteroidales bacterium]|nr:MCP four helix bundle domain-containing protein [Bacteroidales bacterium]
MKKFKDIKTRTQLFIGFGFIFILIFVLSLVSVQQTDKMAHRTENIYNHPLQVRRALATFESSALKMRVEFRNILLASDEKTWNIANRDYQIEKNQAEEQMKILYERFLGDKKDIDSLKEYFLRWNLMQEEDINKSTPYQIDEILLKRLFDGEIITARELLFNKIRKIDDFAKNKADQFYNESKQLNQQLNSQFFLFVIITLVLILLIVYYLSSLINGPLKEITRATSLFMGGDRSVRSSYTSMNEFGQLSDSFNEMAEIVETEFILNNHSASLAGIMLKEDDAKAFCSALLKNLLKHTNSQLVWCFCSTMKKSASKNLNVLA